MLFYSLILLSILLGGGIVIVFFRKRHATGVPSPDAVPDFLKPSTETKDELHGYAAVLANATTIIPDPVVTHLAGTAELHKELSHMSKEELAFEVLKDCYDPEIPVNIVDLGLIYGVTISGASVHVTMTLTAAGCPAHATIRQDVKNKLMDAGFSEVEVQIVWEPVWTAQRISEAGRRKLGLG